MRLDDVLRSRRGRNRILDRLRKGGCFCEASRERHASEGLRVLPMGAVDHQQFDFEQIRTVVGVLDIQFNAAAPAQIEICLQVLMGFFREGRSVIAEKTANGRRAVQHQGSEGGCR